MDPASFNRKKGQVPGTRVPVSLQLRHWLPIWVSRSGLAFSSYWNAARLAFVNT